LYARYVKWCARQVPPCAAAKDDWFRRVRKERFPELHKEKSTDLPICSVCTKAKARLETEMDERIRRAIITLLRRHEELVEGEWTWFRAFTVVAREPSSPELFVLVDGSPGATLPALPANAPLNGLSYRWVGINIFGANGFERKVLYPVIEKLWPDATGCDLWLSALLNELRIYLNNCDVRPRHLVLHLDNTVRYMLHLLCA
jgi:hypothetical protein